MFLQLFAAFIDGDRLLQRDGALFELIDDRFELGESLFEGQAGNVVWGVVQERTSWQGRRHYTGRPYWPSRRPRRGRGRGRAGEDQLLIDKSDADENQPEAD